MNTKKSLTIVFLLSFTLIAFHVIAWAGNTPLSLRTDKSHRGASGMVSLSEDSVTIQATGLRPNAIYTVWFVNMKPKKHEAGAGQPPYMFKTDAKGKGAYTSSLNESPFGRWQTIMIVLHPDGDPTNMKNMVGALSSEIPKSS